MSLAHVLSRNILILIILAIATTNCAVNECLGDCDTPKETITELNINGISLGIRPRTTGFRFVSGEYGEMSDGYISGTLGILALPDAEYESQTPFNDINGTSRDYELGGRNIIYFSRYENGIEVPLDSRMTFCGGSESREYLTGETVYDPTIESVFASGAYNEFVDTRINHVLVRVNDYCIPKHATHIVHRVVGNDMKTRIVKTIELTTFRAWRQLVN